MGISGAFLRSYASISVAGIKQSVVVNWHDHHYNPPCRHPHCTYAHSDLELQTWNKLKKEALNCKLKNDYVYGSLIFM